MKELQEIIRRLSMNGATGGVLATLVSVTGSSYRRPGARLLIEVDGVRVGSISGGCLEEDLLTRANRVASTGIAEAAVYDTTAENDLLWGVGLGCHGIVRVFLERVRPHAEWATALSAGFSRRSAGRLAVVHDGRPADQLGTRLATADEESSAGVFVDVVPAPVALAVFGAGDDALPLVRLANELGWNVTVADPRPAQATTARFPAANVICKPVDELASAVPIDERTVVVIMTHHYVFDRPLLRALLSRPTAYVGLLGPRKRAEKILGDLAAEGFSITPEQRRRLHAPTGLDLGADGPEQVAVAIVAEIQATLARRNAQPLRERVLPIHQ